MARDIDTKRTMLLSQEDRDKAVNSIDEADATYLRQRPWMIQEYRDMGYGDQMDKVEKPAQEGVEPPSQVTTEDMRVGVQDPQRRVQPNGDGQPASTLEEDDYDTWTKDELVAEVNERNDDGRPDDQKLSTSGTKADLVERLRADDEANA